MCTGGVGIVRPDLLSLQKGETWTMLKLVWLREGFLALSSTGKLMIVYPLSSL